MSKLDSQRPPFRRLALVIMLVALCVAILSRHGRDEEVAATSEPSTEEPAQRTLRSRAFVHQARRDPTLAPQGSLRGVVQDAAGGPVPAAVIQVVSGALRFETASDEEGRFGFDLPEGQASLTARAEGYAPARLDTVSPSTSADLTLVPESVVRGGVISALDGRPLAGVQVDALSRSAPLILETPSTTSRETGEFEFRGLEAGSYTLIARGERCYGVSGALDVELASALEGVLIEAVPAATVRGEVSFADGTPCEDGSAMLGPYADPLLPPIVNDDKVVVAKQLVETYVASIGADGELTFRGVQRGRYHLVLRCANGVLRAGPRVVEVGAQDVTGLAWKVEATHRLFVHAFDEAHQPVAGATVLLKFDAAGSSRKGLLPSTTDASGVALFSNLMPGTVELQPNGADATPPVPVRIGVSEPDTHVSMQLSGSGYIAVSVLADDGSAVDGIRVQAVTDATVSAEQQVQSMAVARGAGRYRIGPLSSGTYTVRASDGVNRPVELANVRVSTRAEVTVRLALPARAELAGRVVDDRGAPVGNAWVSAAASGTTFDSPGPSLARRGRTLTDAEGAFLLRDLSVDAPGYDVRVEAGPVTAVANAVKVGSSLQLTLPSPLKLAGTLLDDGKPLTSGASVRVLHEATGTTQVTAVRRDGRFELGVMPGRVELIAFTPDGRSASQALSLEPGAPTPQVALAFAPQSPAEP